MLVGLLVLALITASGAGAAPVAYVSSFTDNNVTVIDGTNVIDTVLVGVHPQGVAVNPAGTRAYVVNSALFTTAVPSVSVIDTVENTEIATVTGLSGFPTGIAVSPDGTRVYVASDDGSVAVIDASSNTVVDTRSTGGMLGGIVAAGSSVYVTDLLSGSVIDVMNNRVLVVGSAVMGIAANPADPSGSRLYVSTSDSSVLSNPEDLVVTVIDTTTSSMSIVTRVPIGSFGNRSGRSPAGVAVSPSGSFIYATILSEDLVAVIDAASNTVVARVGTAGHEPFGVAVDPTGTRLYVVNSATASSNVTVFDATTNPISILATVPVGKDPMAFGSFVALPPPPQFALSLTPSGRGSITAQPTSASGKYAAGTMVTLTATPDPGSLFTTWSGDCSGTSSTCSVTMNAAKSVTATFTAQYALVLTTLGPGSISAVPEPGPLPGKYPAGAEVTLTATPDPSSVFSSWSGACSGSLSTCKVTMDAAKSVTATFTLKQYSLTWSTNGNGAGSVTANPPGGTYTHGTVVSLTAAPAASSLFSSWSGACTGTGACNVTMDAAKSVTGTFTLKQYTLTMVTSGNGSISANPPGGTYSHGTFVALTATPAAGYQFTSWSGACSGLGTCNVLMDAAKGVTATFTATAPPPPQFTLTVTTVGSGSIAVLPPAVAANSLSLAAQPSAIVGKYKAGTLVTLTPTAAPGSKFTGWSGACTGTGVCSVTMNADKTATATFTVASEPPATCDEKIKDWQKKVADHKHPWWHNHQLRISLKMYTEALAELGRAKAKVGDRDKRYVHAQKEFNDGKSALCHGHYWRADNEFWDAYQIAHQVLKQSRR